jgi:hypothetical protein
LGLNSHNTSAWVNDGVDGTGRCSEWWIFMGCWQRKSLEGCFMAQIHREVLLL